MTRPKKGDDTCILNGQAIYPPDKNQHDQQQIVTPKAKFENTEIYIWICQGDLHLLELQIYIKPVRLNRFSQQEWWNMYLSGMAYE